MIGQRQVQHLVSIELEVSLHLGVEEVLEGHVLQKWVAHLALGYPYELVLRDCAMEYASRLL